MIYFRNLKFNLLNLSIFLLSSILIGCTSVSLIFLKLPKFIYLNCIGIFVFCINFGFFPSLFYAFFIQCIFIKFRLVDNFLNLSFIIQVVQILLIFSCLSKKENYIKEIISSSIILIIFEKFLSVFLAQFFLKFNYSLKNIFNIKNFLDQVFIYAFSGFVVLIIFYVISIFRNKKFYIKE